MLWHCRMTAKVIMPEVVLWLQVFSSLNDVCTWNATNYGLAFPGTHWAILTLFTVYDYTIYKDSGLICILIYIFWKTNQPQTNRTITKANKKLQPRILLLDRKRVKEEERNKVSYGYFCVEFCCNFFEVIKG